MGERGNNEYLKWVEEKRGEKKTAREAFDAAKRLGYKNMLDSQDGEGLVDFFNADAMEMGAIYLTWDQNKDLWQARSMGHEGREKELSVWQKDPSVALGEAMEKRLPTRK